jgi:hypothetical protein
MGVFDFLYPNDTGLELNNLSSKFILLKLTLLLDEVFVFSNLHSGVTTFNRTNMADSSMKKTKYFDAVADNKRIDAGLKVYELRIDGFRKKAINRIWKTKFDLLDELVLLNVVTPECKLEKTKTSSSNRVSLRSMNLDDKLFSSKPVSFGYKKSKTPMAPVIEVNGTEAVCYYNIQ